MRLTNKQETILQNEKKNQSTDIKLGWEKNLDNLKIDNFSCINQTAEVIGQTTTLIWRQLHLHIYYYKIYWGKMYRI